MRIRFSALVLIAFLSCAPLCAQEGRSVGAFTGVVAPFVKRWCHRCHGGTKPKGDLDLTAFTGRTGDEAERRTLRHVRDRLRRGEMPPKRRPPAAEVNRVLAWMDETLAAAEGPVDPGRVTVRRLSRLEYVNTVRDLLGVDASDVAAGFPGDDLGYGFDNIGDALSFSLLHIEKYAAAAEVIAERAIDVEDPANPTVRRFEAELMTPSSDRGLDQGAEYTNLYSASGVSQKVVVPRDGSYVIRVRAFGQQAGPDTARMGVVVDGRPAAELEVAATREEPGLYEHGLRLTAGRHEIGVEFVNDYYRPDDPDESQRDRNLLVDWVAVVGPVDARDPPAGHDWLCALDPGRGRIGRRAWPVVKELARRAWRRPPTTPEVKRLVDLVKASIEAGDSYLEAVRVAIQAALVSPHFLFRLELDGNRGRSGSVRDLGDYQLASRLSYFVWSSMPDERLLELARKKKLRDEETLVAEARRLLADDRAEALAGNFAAQWLELRNLADIAPDPERYPEFDEELRTAMRRETELLFDAVRRERRPLADLLRADFTFLNERIARHYGIEGVSGSAFRRVQVDDARRRGLLGHASIHAVTSNPTRTSPVKRGKWLLENLLDAPPPPPPPGADSLKGGDEVGDAATLRELMKVHRSDPACAACHDRLDPLGFSLENFGVLGRWRDEDGGRPVDASGRLPGGERLDGPASLRTWILRGGALRRAVTKKLFVYAIGRPPGESDAGPLERVLDALGDEATLEEVVVQLVRLDAFRRRRIEK